MFRGDKRQELIVDLFCGCGGFSLGAELAGFHTAVAIDVDATLQSAFRINFPSSSLIQASVAEVQAPDWKRLLKGQRVSGLIGGPPCQGFSWIGKRDDLDPRNNLIFEFYRHVSILRPKFFVMENVDGLLHPTKIGFLEAALEQVRQNYVVLPPIVINAKDFGAPTSRKRVIVAGYDPREMEPLYVEDFAFKAPLVTVRDAIADLPPPLAKSDADDFGWAHYPPISEFELSDYARRMRSAPPASVGSELSKTKQMQGLVSGLANTVHSRKVADRYLSILPGKSDPISKSVKLIWEGTCPTLRAGTGQEKGAFQAVRPLHPDQGRVITVREAARLQGFPDWFTFHPAKWHSFRMIGNSVSPVVSEGIFSMIASKLSVALAA